MNSKLALNVSVTFLIAVSVTSFCYGTPSPSPFLNVKQQGDQNMDVKAVTAACNETFRIQYDYLKELNETGAFPDETDKTPMVSNQVKPSFKFSHSIFPNSAS